MSTPDRFGPQGPDSLWWGHQQEIQDDHDLWMYGQYREEWAEAERLRHLDEPCHHLPLPRVLAPAVLVEMYGHDPQDPERSVAA